MDDDGLIHHSYDESHVYSRITQLPMILFGCLPLLE
jgi:hypothetical protein